MNINTLKVGDIIPFPLIGYCDVAFRWKGINHTNHWRMGQIVRIDGVNGKTLRIKDLLTNSAETANISLSYLSECLVVADSMKLAECMMVFAQLQSGFDVAPVAVGTVTKDVVKIEVRENNNKVLELTDSTRYVAFNQATDEFQESFGRCEKTLKEWEKYIAEETEDEYGDGIAAEELVFYAKVDLGVKVKKTVEVSIS